MNKEIARNADAEISQVRYSAKSVATTSKVTSMLINICITIRAIPVRRPSTDEGFANIELEQFELTYDTPDWDHLDPTRGQMEARVSG
jgi:hypothetical protein